MCLLYDIQVPKKRFIKSSCAYDLQVPGLRLQKTWPYTISACASAGPTRLIPTAACAVARK